MFNRQYARLALVICVFALSLYSCCAGSGGGVNAPGAPFNVTASDGAYADRVVLTWEHAGDCDTFEVWRKAADGEWRQHAVVTETTFHDLDVEPGITHHYKVRARLKGVSSADSNSDPGTLGDSSHMWISVAFQSYLDKPLDFDWDDQVVLIGAGTPRTSIISQEEDNPNMLPCASFYDLDPGTYLVIPRLDKYGIHLSSKVTLDANNTYQNVLYFCDTYAEEDHILRGVTYIYDETRTGTDRLTLLGYVTINITDEVGFTRTLHTDQNGYFDTWHEDIMGSVTVTPVYHGFTFTPESISVDNVGFGPQDVMCFIATRN